MTTCRKCGAAMQKVTERSGGAPVGSMALALVGVALLFVFPVGTVIGALLIVTAVVLGYPRKKIWTCQACGFQHV